MNKNTNKKATLLDRTRKIGYLLRTLDTKNVVFNDFCAVLSEVLASHVLVISRKGKVLGRGTAADMPMLPDLCVPAGEKLDPLLCERLMHILSTQENVLPATLGIQSGEESVTMMVCPVEIALLRLGSVVIYRYGKPYDIEDIVVGEYGTTVVALAQMRSRDEESARTRRLKRAVEDVYAALSYSEQEAVRCVFAELHEKEGIVVTSRIADRIGITRSVIVNALRKLEGAGIIESRSSGMKGTYLRVRNPYLREMLAESDTAKN